MGFRRFALGTGAVAAVVVGLSGAAQAQQKTQVGTLTCNVAAGIGVLVGSQKALDCLFTSAQGELDVYNGTITRLGIDIGFTGAGRLVWAVFAPSRIADDALAGTYVGAGAEATAVAGVGANVLVGGSNQTISLQPLSVQGQVGLSLAAGVAGITLVAVPNVPMTPPPPAPARRR
ncbi:DUF992 domain-containing protein [Chelatococcus reniformis]|uniref:DUF992 domain-containing protein n=1 Tax=Chelatococcus reniformis TaxID=1494448 RepID=A0A916UQB8_9HYPH|nr:DUF992 domain-containing protein [Chelatococcus reniformis]GGC82694.1 hypothetical protein GCM10010994_45750 [Chelatococcus reniformis]